MNTLELLQTLNGEDAHVAPAVLQVLPELAVAVDLAVDRIRAGGTVHYFGAGTSGRLAVIDAAELMPTFNAPDGLFVAHHAGGAEALLKAVENVEDNAELGAQEASVIGPLDVVVGITASGRTPYVAGALSVARARGALTVLITGVVVLAQTSLVVGIPHGDDPGELLANARHRGLRPVDSVGDTNGTSVRSGP